MRKYHYKEPVGIGEEGCFAIGNGAGAYRTEKELSVGRVFFSLKQWHGFRNTLL